MSGSTFYCPIWTTEAALLSGSLSSTAHVFSVRSGGEYLVTDSAIEQLARATARQRAILTSWLVEQRRTGASAPVISTAVLETVFQNRPLKFSEKREGFFRALAAAGHKPGPNIWFADKFDGDIHQPLHPQAIMAWMGVETFREAIAIILMLRDEGCLGYGNNEIEIAAKGFERMEQLEARGADTLQAFVAMWFDPSMKEAWRTGFAPGIRDAGYEPFRIDGLEHNGKIDDAIVAEIKRSRFLIADFTCGGIEVKKEFQPHPRGGVYYEAGLAHGLGLDVIFTCREDRMKWLHFDTRQFAHIVWTTPADLRSQLYNRIAATLKEAPGAPGRGKGSVDPADPPVQPRPSVRLV